MANRDTHSALATLARVRPPASERGYIFDVTRFAVHDGPGIRTTVFFKGCPLHCIWCHNPESIHPLPEIMLYPGKCIGCGECVRVCPQGAQQMDASGEHAFRRDLCRACGRCAVECYAGALVLVGKERTVDEVMALIQQDVPFYERSGGGVTLSGGEPLLQGEFARAILQRCHDEGLHTAVETCGMAPWRSIEHIRPHVDLWLYDLKHLSPTRHKRYTGASNRLILANLCRLAETGAPIEIRIPLIPTVNDERSHIEAVARFLSSLPHVPTVRLLAYHHMAGSKYTSLGQEDTMPAVDAPTARHLREIMRWMAGYGVIAFAPSTIDRVEP